MVIVNLDQVEFGDLIHLVTDTNEIKNCIIGRQIGTREGDQESNEKQIILMDFSASMRVSTAMKLGMKFFHGHQHTSKT